MVIALVGGGTGGHFHPLMAVAEVLKNNSEEPKLYYFGPTPYEPEVLDKFGIKYVWCPAGKLRLYFSLKNLIDPFLSFFGIFVAIWKLYVIYPDVILSKGSFTSVPVLLAARFLRIPVVIHESDAVPGRANKLAGKFARYIAISYDDTAQYFEKEKTALVGIPVRSVLKTRPEDPFAYLGIPNDMPLIYVTGGSLGAERMNNVILRSLDELLPKYRIFHQTGSAHQDELHVTAKSLVMDQELKNRYYIKGYMSGEMVSAILEASSLVITRAGSTTLAEVALYGKPSIVIPIPEDVSRDQLSNAYAYARSGAATVMEEHNLTETLLTTEIDSILGDAERQQKMSQAALSVSISDAAEKISSILLKIGNEHKMLK